MKKLYTVITILFMSLLLVSCTDKKAYDDSINVIFYTYRNDISIKPGYFNLEANRKIDEPELIPMRNGYQFLGWYKNINGTVAWDFEIDMVLNKSIVLFAKWKAQIFNITYETSDGIMPADYVKTFMVGERGKTLPSPTKTGASFMAWYTYPWKDENGISTTKPGDFGYQSVPTSKGEDLVLYAHYKSVTADISFRSNFPEEGKGPANPDRIIYEYGQIINFDTFEDFVSDKYEFVEWNSNKNGTGRSYINGEVFTRSGTHIIYAIWKLK